MKLPFQKGKNEQTGLQMLSRAAVRMLQLSLLAVTAFLAYEGVRYSYYSSMNYAESIFEVKDSTLFHLLFFAVLCAAVTVFWRVLERMESWQEKLSLAMLVLAGVWIAVIGFCYVGQHPYTPNGDQLRVAAAAAYAMDGNFLMFVNGGYIGMYEQQKGLVFFYEILFRIFGQFRYDIVAKIHVLLSVVTLIAGYGFLKQVSKKAIFRILYCGMMMFCMPFLLYLPYVYGDLPSICFTMILFWALAAYGNTYNHADRNHQAGGRSYWQEGRKRYVVIAAVAAALALLLRMNTWIVLIAVAIGLVLLALEKKTVRPLIAALCILLAAWGSVKTVDAFYEYRSGCESGVGIPAILWIAMGLQETEGNPGVYNYYQQGVFTEQNLDREAASAVGRTYIKERLREMAGNPGYAKHFFLKKAKMQWTEPLFESLYATENFEENVPVPRWAGSLYYGRLHDVVWKAANYYQSIVYLAVFALVLGGLISQKFRFEDCAAWIPLIAVVGGFLFSILWENQCRYVLPYYVYLVMYASLGMGRIAEAAGGIGRGTTGKPEEQSPSESTGEAA